MYAEFKYRKQCLICELLFNLQPLLTISRSAKQLHGVSLQVHLRSSDSIQLHTLFCEQCKRLPKLTSDPCSCTLIFFIRKSIASWVRLKFTILVLCGDAFLCVDIPATIGIFRHKVIISDV